MPTLDSTSGKKPFPWDTVIAAVTMAFAVLKATNVDVSVLTPAESRKIRELVDAVVGGLTEGV